LSISSGGKYFEDYSEREIWDGIKSNKTAIGFHYTLGEGDGRSIAYSKK
jgi:hypothetical protein